MRPNLIKEMSIKDFKDYYWLKEELQNFCRENGMSASGSKLEISERIETFLMTGEIKKPLRKSRVIKNEEPQSELSLDTVITENHRCSQDVRAFFKSVIPKFHFSTYIQNYFKNNIGKTYRDVVDAWYVEENGRKTLPIRKPSHLNLNTINLFEIFLLTQKIRGKVVTRRLRPGIKSKSFLEGINMNHQIHFESVDHR